MAASTPLLERVCSSQQHLPDTTLPSFHHHDTCPPHPPHPPQVMATIRTGSPIARMLFDRAYAYKRACLLRGDPDGGRWGAIYDRLIFSKVGT